MKQKFDGTLFRFPLRTQQLADTSEIINVPTTAARVMELFTSFKKQSAEVLLFLKSVEVVEFYVKNGEEGEGEGKELFRVSVDNLNDQDRKVRGEIAAFVKELASSGM